MVVGDVDMVFFLWGEGVPSRCRGWPGLAWGMRDDGWILIASCLGGLMVSWTCSISRGRVEEPPGGGVGVVSPSGVMDTYV